MEDPGRGLEVPACQVDSRGKVQALNFVGASADLRDTIEIRPTTPSKMTVLGYELG